MDILALARVRKDQELSNCANLAAFQTKISAPLPDVVCVCLTVQSLEPFAAQREGWREEHLNRVQQGSSLGLEQGQNPKWKNPKSLANRDRTPNGRSPLAVAVVKTVEKILKYLLLYHSEGRSLCSLPTGRLTRTEALHFCQAQRRTGGAREGEVLRRMEATPPSDCFKQQAEALHKFLTRRESQ